MKATDAARRGPQTAMESPGLVHYAVPALSNLRRLPDTPPLDGRLGGTVMLIAARGEFEAASFLLQSRVATRGRTAELVVGDLQGPHGTLPAATLDLRVVKVWAQSGCGWCSYFADAGERMLVPDLLLHDESLVEVDLEKMENTVRSAPPGGPVRYLRISDPEGAAPPVSGRTEHIRDAASLQPFALEAGRFKQFWITFRAPEDAEGWYRGKVEAKIDGRLAAVIPLAVRVLPFALPEPRTRYDPGKPFIVSAYTYSDLRAYLRENGNDWARAEARLLREYTSFRDHNLMRPMLPTYTGDGPDAAAMTGGGANTTLPTCKGGDLDIFRRQLALYRQAGLATDFVIDGVRGTADPTYLAAPERARPLADQEVPAYVGQTVQAGLAALREVLGQDVTVYCVGRDEPSMPVLRAQRAIWKRLADQGLKVYSTANARHLAHAGFNEDMVNYGGSYGREQARAWHALGVPILAYGAPHFGPENPDFIRRRHGLDLYLADMDGTNNWAVNPSQWNDFGSTRHNFRSFNLVYPSEDGHIDTIHYEAFREAIDDVRYATLLQRLAREAIASGETLRVYRGKAALQWLVQVDARRGDLNALRLEMIARILDLGNFDFRGAPAEALTTGAQLAPPRPGPACARLVAASTVRGLGRRVRNGVCCPAPVYTVPVVGQAPVGVQGWRLSGFRGGACERESRFTPYSREGAASLALDVTAERPAAALAAEGCGPFAFHAAADADGFHFYGELAEPRAEEVAAGLLPGAMLEMYLRPAAATAYLQWLLDLNPPAVKCIDWMSPHRGFRPLADYLKVEVARVPEGFGVYVSIPWEALYDQLPGAGEEWVLGVIANSRSGAFTWGSGQVHDLGTFGRLVFDDIGSQLPEIRRRLVVKAWGRFLARAAGHETQWCDEFHGDPEFARRILAPEIARLKAAGQPVPVALDAGTVSRLFEEAVPDWMEFDYRVAELRTDWLTRWLAP